MLLNTPILIAGFISMSGIICHRTLPSGTYRNGYKKKKNIKEKVFSFHSG